MGILQTDNGVYASRKAVILIHKLSYQCGILEGNALQAQESIEIMLGTVPLRLTFLFHILVWYARLLIISECMMVMVSGERWPGKEFLGWGVWFLYAMKVLSVGREYIFHNLNYKVIKVKALLLLSFLYVVAKYALNLEDPKFPILLNKGVSSCGIFFLFDLFNCSRLVGI